MTRRFWIGLALAAAGLRPRNGRASASADVISSRRTSRPGSSSRWRRRSCFGPAGRSSCAAGASIVTRNLNMFTLIAMGTGVAWVYSVVATTAPGLFPPAFRAPDGGVAVYFEAAAVITVLVLLGQVLELRARERTGGAIRALLDLAPKTARRLNADGGERGDAARPGRRRRPSARAARARRSPVDGVVLEGRSARRRIDGDGRVDAGGQERGRQGDRRHARTSRARW